MFGQPLKHLGETASTNDDAAAWAREGAGHGSVVRADAQTRGRGRLGRSWSSPANMGLYFSVVLRPQNLEIERVPQLTMIAAVSCAQAIEDITGLRASVKWPNDVILHGRKIGGILSEAHGVGRSQQAANACIEFAIVGIGLNVDFQASDLPRDVKIPATSLRMETGDVGLGDQVLKAVLRAFETNYNRFIGGEWSLLRDEFVRRDVLQNQVVRVETASETYRGVVRGVTDNGILQVQTPAGWRKVVAGDVLLDQ